MKLETKLNIEDEIYFLHDKKVIHSKVQGIKIEIIGKHAEFTYLCNSEKDKNVNLKVEEKYAFKSKEDLLKSL